MADLKAYILNCTLKKSPEPSHTEALINKIVGLYKPYGVQCEVERAVDYNIPFGIVSDLGAGDDWPKILKKDRRGRYLHHRYFNLVWSTQLGIATGY